MNETFLVGSLFDCTLKENFIGYYYRSAIWKETVFGCRVLNILQDIYKFKRSTAISLSILRSEDKALSILLKLSEEEHAHHDFVIDIGVTYAIQEEYYDVMNEMTRYNNNSVDIFARPLSLRSDLMALNYPIHDLLDWNIGFTIYRPETFINSHNFYRQPFSSPLWYCLYGMAIFCSVLFYFFKCWEIRLVTGVHWECSFGYELLMAIGAYCQHIPPIDAVLYSRRGAYFAFFMFAYVVYTYYTSNLLSHLVNDKDSHIDAVTILGSDFDCLILEDVKWIVKNNIAASNMGAIYDKVFDMKSVTTLDGLKAIKSGETALLSDYVSLEPFIRTVFENYEICRLTKIDVISNLRKYFYVSLEFKYKEEFKVAFLRMEEAGILSRNSYQFHPVTECVPLNHVQTQLSQIVTPLGLLLAIYGLCVLILVGEVIHFKRNRLWPYVN